MSKVMSQQEIANLIKATKKQIADFERSIKTAPKEVRGEYKIYCRQNKTRLRKLEEIFKTKVF